MAIALEDGNSYNDELWRGLLVILQLLRWHYENIDERLVDGNITHDCFESRSSSQLHRSEFDLRIQLHDQRDWHRSHATSAPDVCRLLSKSLRPVVRSVLAEWLLEWAIGSHVRSRPALRSTSWVSAARTCYSITSSAMVSRVSGILIPSALAVFRLTRSSNLVGRSTGIFAGFSPLRILSTSSAARRYSSRRSAP